MNNVAPQSSDLHSERRQNTEATRTAAGPSAVPRPDVEPIAIIGLACRFPGANSAGEFWRLLCERKNGVREIPRDRWDLESFYDADNSVPGKMNTRYGHFLDEIDKFDPLFFGISPREAIQIDPQQRLMLELSWEALEDAGLPSETLEGTRAGIFFGAMGCDYASLLKNRCREITQHTVTGQDASIIAARVAYTLGLQGPCLVVNTASSSSLVAVHLACECLQNGQSELALAGGVNLIIDPEKMVALSKLGTLSPDKFARPFDARANGYVRGEGAAVVVLKALSKAVEDRDPVYCVIRGSAVNNDGFGYGLAAPNPHAQGAVLRKACERARASPSQVFYVETHGTGTVAGDTAEAKSLGTAIGRHHPSDQPLLLGSVKNNIGHLEAAAGIAGLTKVALALKHGTLPPTLNFEQPNPNIPFEDLRLKVQTDPVDWPNNELLALAGVSSFGLGGTNCHLVLEAPRQGYIRTSLDPATYPGTNAQSRVNKATSRGVRSAATGNDSQAHLFLLSARTPEARRALALSTSVLLSARQDVSLSDLCYTASTRRSHLNYRLALVCHSLEVLVANLTCFAQGEIRPGVLHGNGAVDEKSPSCGRKTHVVPSLQCKSNERTLMLEELAKHYVNGRSIEWQALYPHGKFVSLPSYPWQRQRYWIDYERANASVDQSSFESSIESGSYEPTQIGIPDCKPQNFASESPAHHKQESMRVRLTVAAERERRSMLEDYLTERTASVLMLSRSRLDIHQTLIQLGVDSLMALELESCITSDLEIAIPVGKLLQDLTVAQLTTELLSQLPILDSIHPVSGSQFFTGPDDEYEILRV